VTDAPDKPGPTKASWSIPPWAPRPLHAVVVAFVILLVSAFPKDRAAMTLGALALAVRLGLSPRWVLLGGDAAYERLLTARGGFAHDTRYGDGWAAAAGLVSRAVHGDPVHALNLVLSALTVPMLVRLVRATGDERAALSAGFLLAISPLAVALAGMEDAFVLVGLLQLAALGVVARGRVSPWLAAVATGLVAHVRPEQAVFCLLPLGLLAFRREWVPLALAAGLCAWRWADLLLDRTGQIAEGAGILSESRWLDLQFVRALPVPARHAAIVALDPVVTPAAIVPLAVIGLALAPRRASAVPLAALVVSLALYVPKTQPYADPYRFQLPTMALWAALAGIGLAELSRRSSALAAFGAVAVALTTVFARDPLGGGWAWQHEYRFLTTHAPAFDANTTVLYRADQDPNHAFGRWLQAVSPANWQPIGSLPPSGLVYRGTADRIAGVWPPVPCELEPLDVEQVPAATDGWVDLGADPVPIGFYRVAHCDP
jgi:hypothetical protein